MIPWWLLPLALTAGVILGVIVTLAVCAAMSAGRRGGLIEFQPTPVEPERDVDEFSWTDAA